MIKSKLIKIAAVVLVLAAVFLVTACENELIPTGKYSAIGGLPGGGSATGQTGPGWGTADPSYTGRRFDTNNFPSPAAWNQLGHQHNFPDPFHFANGNKVNNLEDWTNRRKEISSIVQYYEYGIMPPIDEDTIDISWVDSGVANCAITVTHKASGRQVSWTQNTTLPAALATAANRDKANLPLALMGTSSAGWNNIGGTGSWSHTLNSEEDGSGPVATLFGLALGTLDTPSQFMSNAWIMSVTLTVMEGIDKDGNGTIDPGERGFRGYYNPNWVGIDGYSRYGKSAMVISAFAESRRGAKVGYASIGSAGGTGPALERFLSPAGYSPDGQYADPLPVGQPGVMEFDDLIGKPWYMKKINNGDLITGTDLRYASTPGGSADQWRYRVVRGWSPYFETYEQTPTNYGTALTTPFVTWQNPGEAWSGIEPLATKYAAWVSERFKEFADLHYGLDIDHVRGNEGRSKIGILCTMPLDQHYLGILIAPRGLIFQEGYMVPRNNPESQFANWMIADEAYKMYGELESNDPYKYLWNNGFVMTWGKHGENTGNEGADKSYHFRKIIEGAREANGGINGASGETNVNVAEGSYTKFFGSNLENVALSDPNLMKMRTPFFQVDDPISRFDYYRMPWGRPGHPTIADRVKSRVEPILEDYFAGEASRPRPSALAPATHPSYTPRVKGFKEMDWRGLLDNPEPLE